MGTSCDIFCNVIDNFGDVGVCWRLARQLSREHGVTVRLWVNDLATFGRLAPALDTASPRQTFEDITVCRWDASVNGIAPARIVTEGFGCTLPPDYLAAMRLSRPVWINLEYLSAEDWVEDCHALPSVHPATGLTQHFWFPGFTPRTGGLLREAGLLNDRDYFDTVAQSAFWHRIGVADAPDFSRRISLFAYENPAIADLLTALADDSANPSVVLIPEGRALADAARWAGLTSLKAGDRLQRGAATLAVLPLLPHADYDRLLWACDLNLVRGEDSFVRAQWAGQPLLWHIYPQDEAAHLVKLEAFIRIVERHSLMPAVWAEAMRAWNGMTSRPGLWAELLASLREVGVASESWGRHLAGQTDLASGLMHFCRRQVE